MAAKKPTVKSLQATVAKQRQQLAIYKEMIRSLAKYVPQ